MTEKQIQEALDRAMEKAVPTIDQSGKPVLLVQMPAAFDDHVLDESVRNLVAFRKLDTSMVAAARRSR
jgi:hypothetical protein